MSCCEGSCSCGKNKQISVQEHLILAQMNTSSGMFATHDWMKGVSNLKVDEEVVEVRFKNNRKEYYRNTRTISLNRDDRVVVDSESGYDLGTVSLTGELAEKQFKKKSGYGKVEDLYKVYRIANQVDHSNWLEAKKQERSALIRARELADMLALKLHFYDAEYRGDGKKLTFYYTVDDRVDFRELLKHLTQVFDVIIEIRHLHASLHDMKSEPAESFQQS